MALIARHVAVFERRKIAAHRKVERRQNCEADRAHQKAEWIEPANCHRAKGRSHQAGDEDDVLCCLPALVAVRFDALLAALGFRRHVAHEMLQRAHRADPAAEETSQKKRGQQNDEAPQQPAIERVRSQRIGDRDQRIPLKEQAHRSMQMNVSGCAGRGTQRGEDQQRDEEEQKENLRDPAPQRQSGTSQESPPRTVGRGVVHVPSMIGAQGWCEQ